MSFEFCLSDIVLMWRVWVVWNRNYWIVLPSAISWCFAMGTIVLSRPPRRTYISYNILGFGFKQVADVAIHSNTIRVNSLPVASSIIIVINTTINTSLIVGRML